MPLNEFPSNISELINKIKNATIKEILKYYYGLQNLEKANLERPELWIQSVLSRNMESELNYFQDHINNTLKKEKGSYDWDCKLREYTYQEYDYEKRKYVPKKGMKKELKFIDFNIQKTEPESIISNLKDIFNKKKKTIKVSSIYEYIHFKKQQYYITIQPHDEVKFLFLSPNNPSMFLSQVIHNNLNESTFFNETSKKNMINLLKGLHEIWYRDDFNESTYLFLATGLLCSDKVARELAAEIWVKANSENKINNVLLGEIIGKLELGEYAPLKRFTDLFAASLFNISSKHNESLFILLDNMIGNMNNEPIRGIKNLLEMFLELKYSFPHIEIGQPTKEKLSKWEETKTLKPIISKIN